MDKKNVMLDEEFLTPIMIVWYQSLVIKRVNQVVTHRRHVLSLAYKGCKRSRHS